MTGSPFDFGLMKTQVSIIAMIMLGFSIAYIFKDSQINSRLSLELCKVFTSVMILNSIIVLFEFYLPSLRLLLESYLIEDGKVDYANGFRYRGLASAGGASLSVAHGISIPLIYYLFKKNAIGPLRLLISITIVFTSLIFIGRTGFVVAFIGIVLVAFIIKSSSEKAQLLSKIWVYIILIISVFLLSYAAVFFVSLPEFYINYSINVFVGGAESLKSEGTVITVISFFHFQIIYGKYFLVREICQVDMNMDMVCPQIPVL